MFIRHAAVCTILHQSSLEENDFTESLSVSQLNDLDTISVLLSSII